MAQTSVRYTFSLLPELSLPLLAVPHPRVRDFRRASAPHCVAANVPDSELPRVFVAQAMAGTRSFAASKRNDAAGPMAKCGAFRRTARLQLVVKGIRRLLRDSRVVDRAHQERSNSMAADRA